MAVSTVVQCDSKGKPISSKHYKNGTPISDEDFLIASPEASCMTHSIQ